jgi:hypothetical protein
MSTSSSTQPSMQNTQNSVFTFNLNSCPTSNQGIQQQQTSLFGLAPYLGPSMFNPTPQAHQTESIFSPSSGNIGHGLFGGINTQTASEVSDQETNHSNRRNKKRRHPFKRNNPDTINARNNDSSENTNTNSISIHGLFTLHNMNSATNSLSGNSTSDRIISSPTSSTPETQSSVQNPIAPVVAQARHPIQSSCLDRPEPILQKKVSLEDLAHPGESSPFCCPVCCESYRTEENNRLRRPYHYECGHTACLECIQKYEDCKCPFCNEIGEKKMVNYGLEQAIDWARKRNQLEDGKELFKSQSLCLNCLETFDPSHKFILGKSHKGHQTIALRDKDPQQMKKVFWIISLLQSDDPARLERAQLTLRMMMDIMDTYMQALQLAQNSLREKPQETKQSLLTDLKMLLQQGAPVCKWRENKLLDALLTVRELEVERSEKVFQLAKDCSIPQSHLLDTKFFEAFERDQKNHISVGVDEQYLGMFPILEATEMVDGQGAEMLKPSRRWLESWRELKPTLTAQ